MPGRRLIAAVLVAAALLGGGVVIGTYGFPQTETKLLVETRTVTVDASPASGETLYVQILDPEPRQVDATSDSPFPLAECETDARFPRVADIAVHEVSEGGGLGALVGLPDASSVAYAPIADEGICTMQFEVPDLAPARFYVVHADSDDRLFQGGYDWRVSAAELERNGWSISLKLGS